MLNIQGIVIDNGSGRCKAGFAGDDSPILVFPSTIGKPKPNYSKQTGQKEQSIVGFKSQFYNEMSHIQYPIEDGIIHDWDGMEQIWSYVFTELNVNSKDRPVLLSEPLFNPMACREKMAQIMFEKFNVPAMYVSLQATLGLYASGRGSAVVLDSGEGATHIVPIYEGYTFPHASVRLDFGGRDLTDYLMELLTYSGYSFCTSTEREIVRDMKEKMCYVAQDFRHEEHAASSTYSLVTDYMLPDGQMITLSSERCRCPEALFQPHLMNFKSDGLAVELYRSVMNCTVDVRRDLFANIVLSGGSTMFPGLPERLQRDVTHLLSSNPMRVRVVARADREYFVWVGGSILASLSTFQKMWVTKEQYDETGPSAITEHIV
ncbi:unnamed protein product [Calicophoron daubneyi]|uniref:Actin n=1 Tax=Calicophoron daubneyi TaxID=300641 RepID=A0AAV2TAS0_CALDB